MRNLKTEMKRWKKQQQKKKPKKQKDKLTDRDWRELMGSNRPIYERRGGAIRQK
ncbi:hypothetical protein [Evansella clarkii]|uniref:hypothetical protein n=1 Tax=Evansella clarkii TaxID=79879 RepID=UPI000B450674|nr:hypothetical protein [Evansella clarkii]